MLRFLLNEYSQVRLRRSVPGIPLPSGAGGVVVYVWSTDPPGYDVEFIDEVGKTLGVYTLSATDLELAERGDTTEADPPLGDAAHQK
jgi:Domain of unknown function (DUF4926)